MTERCQCGAADEWAVIHYPHRGEVAGVVCGSCGADAPGDVAAVLTAEHVLETASTSARAERREAIAEYLPDPPDWIESPEARRAWDAYQRMRGDLAGAGAAPPVVDLPQRDEERDRGRSWTWGQVAIVAWIFGFALAVWATLAAIAIEALT